MKFQFTKCYLSLVPRLHPLMRRNSLVNQVEFLGLAHTFATVSPIATFYTKPTQKVRILKQRPKNLTVVREVLCKKSGKETV